MSAITRRASLLGGGSLVAASALSHGPWSMAAEAATGEAESHGLSVFGDLALPPDFKALPYVNLQAPKGGAIRLQTGGGGGNQNFTTFDTLNIFILKGNGAAGMGTIFDTLMTGSLDEPSALYGLAAKSVRWSADKLTYRFSLRPEARFHDGSPLTAADVAFSLNILKDKGHPVIRTTLRHLDAAVAEDPGTVRITLNPARSRDLPLIIAGQPIFSKAYYRTQPFDQTTLERPLGSSAYKVGAFEQGRFIGFERVKDYWAKDLPINLGQSNFDLVRYEYFRERQVGFEGFKSGVITFQEDFTSINWAKGYDFPAVKDGRVKKETITDQAPRGVQAWWFNSRRPKFQDPRIRDALRYAFDFEWTNQNIMFGLFQRTVSYFQNSGMAAVGTPSPEELALLEPFRGKVSDLVFGEAPMPPKSDGSGQDRALLAQAYKLLVAAGCTRDGTVLKLPSGEPLTIEFLDFQGALERHTAPFIKNLRLLGIDANYRVVDTAQYQARVNAFDYDVVTQRYGASFTPGEDLRVIYGSEAARTPGSQNLTGVADPVVDALIEKALVAQSRAELTTICRCLDRVLRAGFYGVLMWNNPDHWLAYWDLFGRPATPPKYDPGVLSTWWADDAKVQALRVGP
ncbi:extracellular solute-binding protein [Lichenihabitans sp. Uapishka_5]|uniref:extracellular solute-binding protein n=1 Tax=Lichenihabitans sp. Uapishka_5 TaxID=3037302 RepID=UPI0029E81C15|nr:extracellular solute-binding protein [Lichenihabitans sp. Uapishka_5]MDX7949773.1 extracellular solute-binding protein [Lichenihabitans sp. Uapishka_5]